VDVCAGVVADEQPLELVEPGEGSLGHLVDLVSDEAMPLAVNAVGRLGVRCLDEAEDLPRYFDHFVDRCS